MQNTMKQPDSGGKAAGSTLSPSGPARQKRRGIKAFFHRYWENRYLFLLLLPAVIACFIFSYLPMPGIVMAFQNFKFKQGIFHSPWIGLENFETLFRMKSFGTVFKNTLIISFYKLLSGFPAPIIFALLLNEIRHTRFKKAVQTISYLPHFVSWVVLGGLFIQFLSPSSGPINVILSSLGFDTIYFLGDPKWFRTSLVVSSVWKSFGWGSIVYLASITSISPELYEAADIDGAGRFRKMWSITIPEIIPVTTIMLIFAVSGIVGDDFEQIFNLYNEAVYSVGDVLGTYIYRVGLVDMKYSFSTAVGLFRNVISFTLVILTNIVAKRVNEYGIW